MGATLVVGDTHLKHELILPRVDAAIERCDADRVVFLRNGQIVEQGPPEQVIDNPREQATREFLARILH